MATLTVWKFADPDLEPTRRSPPSKDCRSRPLIEVLDGAVVSWPPDKRKPKTRQLHSTTGAGALGGAFWGLLFGLDLLRPAGRRGDWCRDRSPGRLHDGRRHQRRLHQERAR